LSHLTREAAAHANRFSFSFAGMEETVLQWSGKSVKQAQLSTFHLILVFSCGLLMIIGLMAA